MCLRRSVDAFGSEEHLYSGTGVNQGNTYYYSLGGHLIGESNGSSTNMFLTDALGSVIGTISATAGSAAVQGNQAYGPYGNSRYQAGTMGTAKGFTGQYQDATGLDYYNARYYDPVVGRFLSADTVQGNGVGMDPYAYVGDNPETNTDPTGHMPRPPADDCTFQSCTVTLFGTTFTLQGLLNLDTRLQFFQDFYRYFTPGWGTAEIAFFRFLLHTHRFKDAKGYWNIVDLHLAIDQLVAAYDAFHGTSTQNPTISRWLQFIHSPSTAHWWVAHNDSILDGDRIAQREYRRESPLEQQFITETINILELIQFVALGGQSDVLLSLGLSPQLATLDVLTSIFYPKDASDAAIQTAFQKQFAALLAADDALLGPGVGLISATLTWAFLLTSQPWNDV